MIEDIEKAIWTQQHLELIRLGQRNACQLQSKVETYIEAVESGRLYGLPLGLRSITMGSIQHIDTIMPVFPPYTQTIKLRATQAPSKSLFWKLLPPSIESVKIGKMSSNVELWEVMRHSSASDSALFQQTSLRHLTLTLEDIITTLHLSAYLPRSLQYFSLTMDEDDYDTLDGSMQNLPPNLETLHIESSLMYDSSPIQLPRSLKHLLGNASLKGCDLHNLPPQLETLQASFFKVNLAHLLECPKTLRKARIFYEDSSRRCPPFLSDANLQEIFSRFVPFRRLFFLPEEETSSALRDPKNAMKTLKNHCKGKK